MDFSSSFNCTHQNNISISRKAFSALMQTDPSCRAFTLNRLKCPPTLVQLISLTVVGILSEAVQSGVKQI